jgi:NADPH:quinone reductase-like Zn-dependent oxidoreductase
MLIEPPDHFSKVVGRILRAGEIRAVASAGYAQKFYFNPRVLQRGLSLHGFWLINWIRNAPHTEIEEIYQKLGNLVADGSLSATVEHVYPLDQFKEAFQAIVKVESQRQGSGQIRISNPDVGTWGSVIRVGKRARGRSLSDEHSEYPGGLD